MACLFGVSTVVVIAFFNFTWCNVVLFKHAEHSWEVGVVRFKSVGGVAKVRPGKLEQSPATRVFVKKSFEVVKFSSNLPCAAAVWQTSLRICSHKPRVPRKRRHGARLLLRYGQ